MQTVHDVPALRGAMELLRCNDLNIALVPTMGALHEGHMKLIEAAKARADHVVASIFVNPRQFGPNEDFDAYPRPSEKDAALLRGAGVALLWMPSVRAMYPSGYATNVSVSGLGDGLCGAARPGHFDGVATVVAKLFNQVRPDMAFFGEKDWQQLAIIRRMNADLNIGIDVQGVPTVREADGLALSSRNAYLTSAERAAAVALPRAMAEAKEALEKGTQVSETLEKVQAALIAAGFQKPDYVTLAGAEDLQILTALDRPARLLVAARLGKARLIDNWAVHPARKK